MTAPTGRLQRQMTLRKGKAHKVEALNFVAEIRRRLTIGQRLFAAIVIIPSVIAAIYLGLWASDRYVSEAHFIVRGSSGQQLGGLAALFRTFGFSRADDDTFAVQNFLQSRDAVRQLETRLPLREIFSRSEGDLFSRFPSFWRGDSFEALYEHYLHRVKTVYVSSTGITQLQVSAYRPEDARDVAIALLSLSEGLVNRINERAHRDALMHAEEELSRAEAKVISTQGEITSFRNRELLIDPSANSVKLLDTVGKLSTDLARIYAQIQETTTSAPTSPVIEALKVRAAALQDQITAERAKMAGGDNALSGKISAYERLALNREFADRSLTLAAGTIELARQEARRQQIYIETVVSPNLPDEALEPRRWRGFFTVFLFSFAIFAMAWFLLTAVREHAHG